MNHGYLVINLYIGKRENHDKMDKIWEMEKKKVIKSFRILKLKKFPFIQPPKLRGWVYDRLGCPNVRVLVYVKDSQQVFWILCGITC